MLWKAANQQAASYESADITQFGWEIRHGVPTPIVAQGDLGQPYPCGMIHCECRAQGTEVCGCHKEHLSGTSYCNCSGEDGCSNPYTKTEAQTGDDEGLEIEGVEKEDECIKYDDIYEEGGRHGNNFDYLDDDWE